MCHTLLGVAGGQFDTLEQACQTGVPRAAYGPIAYLLRPAVAYLNQTVTQNCN